MPSCRCCQYVAWCKSCEYYFIFLLTNFQNYCLYSRARSRPYLSMGAPWTMGGTMGVPMMTTGVVTANTFVLSSNAGWSAGWFAHTAVIANACESAAGAGLAARMRTAGRCGNMHGSVVRLICSEIVRDEPGHSLDTSRKPCRGHGWTGRSRTRCHLCQ